MMKRPGIVFVFGALVLLLSTATLVRAVEIDGAAAISSIVGQVDIKAGDGEWETSGEGDVLDAGDSVRTGAGSKARLVLEDGSLLVVGEMSIFTLSTLSADYTASTRNTTINLESGSIRAVVDKKLGAGSDFTIETPTAVAGVRGTDFSVEVGDAETTTVTVFDGQVEVGSIIAGIKERVLLDPEHSTEVQPGKPPVKPMKLKKNDLEKKRNKLSQRIKPDAGDSEVAARDQTLRTAVAAHIHKLPEKQKEKLLENVSSGNISADDAQTVLSSVHRGVDRDTVKIALEIASSNDIPKDKIQSAVEMIRKGDPGDLRDKLEKIRDGAGASTPAGNEDVKVTRKASQSSDGAKNAIENISPEDLSKLRMEILRSMDKEQVMQALNKMNPNDPARRELQIIQNAIEKGISREKLEPLINSMKKDIITDREAVLIIEAIRRGIDLSKLEEALRRLHELKVDSQTRMLVLKAMSLNVDLNKLIEKIKASDLSAEELKARLEKLIKDRIDALKNSTDTPTVNTDIK